MPKAPKRTDLEREAARAEAAHEAMIEDAIRAIALRRTGTPWSEVARSVGRSILEVQALAKAGYPALLGQQDPEELRAETEDRIDSIIRAANRDLALAETVSERTALYRLILAAERDRVRVLGYAFRPGDDEGDADA